MFKLQETIHKSKNLPCFKFRMIYEVQIFIEQFSSRTINEESAWIGFF